MWFTFDIFVIFPELFLLVSSLIILIFGVLINSQYKKGFPLIDLTLGKLIFFLIGLVFCLIFNMPFISVSILYDFFLYDKFCVFIKLFLLFIFNSWVSLSLFYINQEKLNLFEYWVLALIALLAMFSIVCACDILILCVVKQNIIEFLEVSVTSRLSKQKESFCVILEIFLVIMLIRCKRFFRKFITVDFQYRNKYKTYNQKESNAYLVTGLIQRDNYWNVGKINNINKIKKQKVVWAYMIFQIKTWNFVDWINNPTVKNSKKIFNFQTQICGFCVLKSVNEIIIDKNYKKSLEKRAQKYLNEGKWPLKNKLLKKDIIIYIKKEMKKTAIKSMNIKILDGMLQSDKSQNKLEKLKKEASKKMNNLIWRIIAIELLSHNSSSIIAGVDGVKFSQIPIAIYTKKIALRFFVGRIKFLKKELSIAKGKTDQAIKRKGLKNLNETEKRKIKLKKNSRILISYRKELKDLMLNPIKKYYEYIKKAVDNNQLIKLNWVINTKERLARNNLKNFKSDIIKVVNIYKEKGKWIPLGIPTIRDRGIQMLWKIIMEPIMEPQGDTTSFGYRPGRNSHQAISYLANCLFYKIKQNKTKKYDVNLWVLNLEIEKCFDNIDHNWLMANTPIPEGYKNVFDKILKSPVLKMNEKNSNINKKIVRNKGLPLGGIISPILMNWTLDGIEKLVKGLCKNKIIEFHEYYYFKSKKKKRRVYGIKNNGWVVRYGDNIIIISNSKLIYKIELSINEFLKKRGLNILREKSRKFKWTIGKKFDFLGWTFHFVKSIKKNWMITEPKKTDGQLNNYFKLYVYPSRESISRLKKIVKDLTSISRTGVSVFKEISDLNFLVKSWSAYYEPGGKQSVLRSGLDYYIWKRTKKFLYNKFKKVYLTKFISYYLKTKEGKWTSLNQKKSGILYNQVISLRKNRGNCKWSLLCPNKKLLNNSAIANPEGYIKRELFLIKLFRDRLKEKLYEKQKGKCTLCNNHLINWENFVSFGNLNVMETEQQKTVITLLKIRFHKKIQTFLKNQKYLNIISDIIKRKFEEFGRVSIGFDFSKKWYQELKLDHKIPKNLKKLNTNLVNTLEDKSNLQLVHKKCYKYKFE